MNNSYYNALSVTPPDIKYISNYYTSKSVLGEAQGHWTEILILNGIEEKFLKNKHGPCPVCGGKDRFRFDNKDGRGTFFCNHCGPDDGVGLLRIYHGWDYNTTVENITKALSCRVNKYLEMPKDYCSERIIHSIQLTKEESYKRRKRLNMVWQATMPIVLGDPVDCYLRARGITLSCFPPILRFHPHLPYYSDEKVALPELPGN